MNRQLRDTFDPRANSIGFLRWLMAVMVIFSHAGPLGGFYGGKDLGTQWSDEQSFGGVAVCGFFFLSGYLITLSRTRTPSTARYLWHRFLRIFPAFWATLIFTAFVLAPIAWVHVHGSLDGFLAVDTGSPLTYFVNNMFLPLNQHDIAGLGVGLPYYDETNGGFEWNGSAWTLAYEFAAYLVVAVLGLVGALRDRGIAMLVAVIGIALATVQWLRVPFFTTALPMFDDPRILLLAAPFAFGMLFALFSDRIPMDWRLAAVGALIAIATYGKGGWLLIGQYAFCYVLMWFAVAVRPLNRWERFGDFSYGIYIIAWPVMQFVAFYDLQGRGWLVYHLVVLLLCHVYAFVSWHLLEKPALSLKRWTPGWLTSFYARTSGVGRSKTRAATRESGAS